jgi:hypothetical protein
MAKVLGVGGLCFKSRDEGALREWYARVLGLPFEPWGGVIFLPDAASGRSALALRGRQHQRCAVADDDRVLLVYGQCAVVGRDRPAVRHLHGARAARRQHRLDGKDEPSRQDVG